MTERYEHPVLGVEHGAHTWCLHCERVWPTRRWVESAWHARSRIATGLRSTPGVGSGSAAPTPSTPRPQEAGSCGGCMDRKHKLAGSPRTRFATLSQRCLLPGRCYKAGEKATASRKVLQTVGI
jgi:hypothetical protein